MQKNDHISSMYEHQTATTITNAYYGAPERDWDIAGVFKILALSI